MFLMLLEETFLLLLTFRAPEAMRAGVPDVS
jgi:hypothetical protein